MPNRILSQPLAVKLAGANALLVVVALGAALVVGLGRGSVILIGLALAVGMVANLLLVHVALSPIRALQETADRLSRGDVAVRVPATPLSDPALQRVSDTVNGLLERMEGDRTRMRELARQVVDAEDRERARLAVVLHESVAQSLTAVLLELAAAEQAAGDEGARARISEARANVRDLLAQVGTLARSLHSSALRDLGIVAGIRELARTAGDGSMRVEVRVDEGSEEHLAHLDRAASAALHRVAQEALQNALRHSRAGLVRIELGTADGRASLRVEDDGNGFEPPVAPHTSGGLFTMRERIALLGGEVSVLARPGAGTVVHAWLRLHAPAQTHSADAPAAMAR